MARHGLPFGWTYDVKKLANDLSAHLVYGLATASGLRLLSR
jgi:hypothetical protein